MLLVLAIALSAGGFAVVAISFLYIGYSHIFKESPFKYPYMTIEIEDNTNKTDMERIITNFIKQHGMEEFYKHRDCVDEWKRWCEYYIEEKMFSKVRRKQYNEALDDENMVVFKVLRDTEDVFEGVPYTYKKVIYERKMGIPEIERRCQS